MPKSLLLGVALALATCLVPMSTFSVLAGNCPAPTINSVPRSSRPNDFEHHYWDGWKNITGSGTIGGVMANIKTMDPYVQPGTFFNNAWVVGWVMLTDSNNYAQAGWFQWENSPGQTYRYAEQGTNNGSFNRQLDLDLYIGTVHTFMVTWKYSSSPFDMWFDGNIFYHGNGNNFTPDEAQNYVEIESLASEMGGGYGNNGGNNETFRGAQVWVGQPGTGNGQWYSFQNGKNTTATHSSGIDPFVGWNWPAGSNPQSYFGEYSPPGPPVGTYDPGQTPYNENVWDWGCN